METEKLGEKINAIKSVINHTRVQLLMWEKDEIAEAIAKAGYLPVEPVKLEALGKDEIEKAIERNTTERYLARHATDAEAKAISQATIAHNEKKGQLYRIKE